jgi:TDG/mug DNA glycosylase family protein
VTLCAVRKKTASNGVGEGVRSRPARRAHRVAAEAPGRPSRADLAAAFGRTIDDVIAPDLAVLLCGINPGLWSGATGHHFARPGNRFWPALHRAGLTPRQLRPDEQRELLRHGFGVTNLVGRATAKADELSAEELRAGADRLAGVVREYRPRLVAVVGVSAYRVAFGRPKATVGPQPERIAGAPIWVLPNPSGLNAHWQLPDLAGEFRRMRAAVPEPS